MDLTTQYAIIVGLTALGMVVFALLWAIFVQPGLTKRAQAKQDAWEARQAVLKDRDKRAKAAMKPEPKAKRVPKFEAPKRQLVDLDTGEVIELTIENN